MLDASRSSGGPTDGDVAVGRFGQIIGRDPGGRYDDDDDHSDADNESNQPFLHTETQAPGQ